MSFFKPQVNFHLNFATPLSVMTHNSSEIFQLKQYMLWTKRAHQCTIFRRLGALMKFHPIPHAIFETTRSGFIQVLHHYSVSWKITPLFSSNLIYFGENSPLKWNFRTSECWVKIHQIRHVIFETMSQFFLKLCITLQCRGR